MKFSEVYNGMKYNIDNYPRLYMYVLEYNNMIREVCFPVENPEKYPIDCIVKKNIGRSLFLKESNYEYASKRLLGKIKKLNKNKKESDNIELYDD